MDKNRVYQIKKQFDRILHSNQEAHIEFWYARDLMPLLGYERWENFDKAISRAMESCEGSGAIVPDHFREVTKMIPAKRPKGLFAQAAWRSLLLSPPGGLFFYSENGRR